MKCNYTQPWTRLVGRETDFQLPHILHVQIKIHVANCFIYYSSADSKFAFHLHTSWTCLKVTLRIFDTMGTISVYETSDIHGDENSSRGLLGTTLRNVGILPHHYMVSQPRRPRLEHLFISKYTSKEHRPLCSTNPPQLCSQICNKPKT
jgi:hypothetical protein